MINCNELQWNECELGLLNVNAADMPSGCQILVFRSKNTLGLNIRSSFWVSSYDKAQGVPHLMEHSLFSKVLDGKSLFNSMSKLNDLGISLNATTSYKDITIEAGTTSCMTKDKYTDDAMYEAMADKYNYKTLLSKIGELHYNLIHEDVDKEYVEKEKNVIYGEMQQSYPGDAQNIRKIAELHSWTGDKYSSIGTRWHIQNISTDCVNYMRKRVFSPSNMKYIIISAPDFVTLEDIVDLYINKLYIGLNDNYNEPKEESKRNEYETFVEDYCMKRYRPNIKSYQVRSIEANDNNKKELPYMHKSKNIRKTANIKDVCITVPTVKYSLDTLFNDTFKCHIFNYLLQMLNQYYREVFPHTYGVQYFSASWRYKKNYTSISYIIKLDEKCNIEEFMKSLEGFKKYALDKNHIAEYIKSRVAFMKNDWYNFMNGDLCFDHMEWSNDALSNILAGSTHESAYNKINALSKYVPDSNKLFSDDKIDDIANLSENQDKFAKYAETYIDNWKVSVFDSNNVYEDDKDNSKKRFKK